MGQTGRGSTGSRQVGTGQPGAGQSGEGLPGAGQSGAIYQQIFERTPDALLLVDRGGVIEKANEQAESLFGYDRSELVGQRVEKLIPDRFAVHHVAHRSDYLTAPRMRPMGAGLELFARRKDQSEFPVDIMLSPIDATSESRVLCVVRDISERKEAERVLDALHEKEVLLKELHHRVKNNLAAISSLFYLQSTYTRDEPTIRILKESQDRVRSMALVHESLYRSENFAAIDFGEYAEALSARLLRSHAPPHGTIELKTELASVLMGVDLAVPCGLILNELMTNALSHAFPDGRSGTIRIGLRCVETGLYALEVSDSGVGIPADLVIEASHSLGLRLIQSLTHQVEGRFELLPAHPGTTARLTVRIAA